MASNQEQGSGPTKDLEALRAQLERLELENKRLRKLTNTSAAQTSESTLTPPNIDNWYYLLSQSVNDVVWLEDMEGRLSYISPAVEHLTGYTQREALALSREQRLSPDSRQEVYGWLQRAFEPDSEPSPYPIETSFSSKDGSIRWVENQVTPLRSPDGKPVGILGVTRNITERRRIREELRERNRLLESIFSNLQQIFFTLDVSNNQLLEISPACEAIYGMPREAFFDNPGWWYHPILEEDRERVMEGFASLRAGDRAESVAEYRIRRPDGALRWLRSAVRRREEAGQIYFDGFVTDITDRKRLESQLQQSQKMEAIGTLAGGIAHDMNNVLGVVMGLGSVLQAQVAEGDPLRKHVDTILSVSRRGRDLTRNLLGFARKGRFRREAVVLNHVVEEVISLLGRTVPKSIVIRTRLDGALDPVEGDPGQLNHALMNLCLNACDAMEEGGTLTISTQNVTLTGLEGDALELAPGRYARLELSDTGEGMPPETAKRVFEPFFSTKPKGRGTGLGLSMVYGTITNHGGQVTLDSEPGGGTTVTLHLPTIARVAETVAALEPHHATNATAHGTVLVVDDEELFRFAAEQMLTTLGYDVIAVDSGAAALEVVREHPRAIRLVLLDLQMPHMDGEETFHALQAIAPDLGVLLCSGFSAESKAEQLLDAGALGYLPKPFEVDTLAVQIARALRKQKRKAGR